MNFDTPTSKAAKVIVIHKDSTDLIGIWKFIRLKMRLKRDLDEPAGKCGYCSGN